MKNWVLTYDGNNDMEVLDLNYFPENTYGFIYKITNKINNKFYVGKKNLFFRKKKRIGKKKLAEITGKGRRPTHEIITTESDWVDYYGSSKTLLEDIKLYGKDNFERKILKLCFSKKELTYFEIVYQINEEVLFNDSYNDNILGKFYSRDFI